MVEHDIFDNITRLFQEISSHLNSEQFYDKLYQGHVDFSEYSSECTSLITPYMSTNKHKLLRRTCTRLIQYLKTEYIPFDKSTHAYDECILLNYWVYSRLVNILGSEVASTIAHPFAILQQIWNDIVDKSSDNSRSNVCKPDISIATQNDWRERKALYDYCVNYDTLEKNLPFFNVMCPKYWNYVERHTPLYKYFDKHCSNQNYKCPKFYTDCKKYDPREVLENFHCHAEMKKKKADTLAKARQELPASIPPGQEANSGMLASSGFSAGGSHLTRDGTHQTTKTGDILLGVVATSLTSGALYRFTPLGRIIRNKFGRNNNSMGNIHGGEYGLFDYASESYNPFTGGGDEHYIGYQPA